MYAVSIPGFTRKELDFWRFWSYIKCFIFLNITYDEIISVWLWKPCLYSIYTTAEIHIYNRYVRILSQQATESLECDVHCGVIDWSSSNGDREHLDERYSQYFEDF